MTGKGVPEEHALSYGLKFGKGQTMNCKTF